MSLTSPVAGITVIEVLGHGGFSVVYRGRQESVGREVALKVDNRMVRDDRDRRRFLREAHAAGQLSDHPNVISVFDAGITDDGRPYLVMELCAAGSLADRLRKDGPLPAADVREVGVRIADALESAHQVGVLHRDLKPANILVNRYGSPGLADFGLAASHDPSRQMSATLEALTPAYAAPEVFRMERPTTAVDIYGLGATLYALLSGRPPRWPAEGHPSIATIIGLQDEPVPDLPGVPSALTAVLRKAMASDPAERFATAADLRDALKGVALDAPTGLFTAVPADEPVSGGPSRGPSGGGTWGAPTAVAPATAASTTAATTATTPMPVSPAGPARAPIRGAAQVPAPPPAPANPGPRVPLPTPPPEPARRRRKNWPAVLALFAVVLVLGACAGISGAGPWLLNGMWDGVQPSTDPGPQVTDAGVPVEDEPSLPSAVEAPAPSGSDARPTPSPSLVTPSEPPYRTADPNRITSVGIGPFRTGEPVEPLLDAGVARRPDGEGPCDPERQLVSTDSRYDGVTAWQDGDEIVHVTIVSEALQTRSGLRVGSTPEEIRAVAPEAQRYQGEETDSYLVPDGGNGLLFILTDGRTNAIVVGPRSELDDIATASGGRGLC